MNEAYPVLSSSYSCLVGKKRNIEEISSVNKRKESENN